MTDNERAVLSALIKDPSIVNRVRAHLLPEDFATPEARSVYETVIRAKDENKDIDLAIVSMEGGADHVKLLSIAEGFVSSRNIGFYCQGMQAERVVKRLGSIVGGPESAFAKNQRPYPKILSQVQEELANMRPIPDSMAESASSVAQEVLAESMEDVTWDVTGKQTGYPALDFQTDGLHENDYVVLGARTSVGKSALALNIATSIAAKEKVLFCSYEMPTKQLLIRLYSTLSSVDSMKIRKRQLSPAEKAALREAKELIDDLKLQFSEDHATTSRLISNIEQAYEQGVRTVVVDYLQLVNPDRPGRLSAYEHVTDVSGRLRDTSKRLGVTILALSQLKRQSEDRGQPALSDLRESGAIEQDADVVLLMHRRREGDVLEAATKLVVAKNRYGDIGTVRLRFEGAYSRFVAV